MEFDQLKSDWKALETNTITDEQIKSMLLENRHPVLKGIRNQLTIEITGWSVFLLCYYTMFDGDQKPLLINLLLVISVLISLVHNIFGYGFSKYLVKGDNIKVSLEYYLSKVKQYAAVSMLSRIIFSAGLLGFLSYNISFTNTKYISLGIIIIIMFLVQVCWLYSIWSKRLKALEETIKGFNL